MQEHRCAVVSGAQGLGRQVDVHVPVRAWVTTSGGEASRSTALLASRPVATMTEGLEVLVQEVNRLGLSPYERLRTCHAAANAVEEIQGISAIDLTRAFIESNPDSD